MLAIVCLGSQSSLQQPEADAAYPRSEGKLRSSRLNQLPLTAQRQSRDWNTGRAAACEAGSFQVWRRSLGGETP